MLLGLLDLVHGGWEGEILDLAWRDALLFFHALDGILHVDILLDTELLEILIELADAIPHLRCSFVELLCQLGLVEVDLAILEVLLARHGVLALLAVHLPVHLAFLLPLFHEVLVFTKLPSVVSTLLLLDFLD